MKRMLVMLLVAFACAALPALAGTVTVLNTGDTGAGSLRNVVAGATAGDTVLFDASLAGKTITLTSGEILLSKDLTIDGEAARIVISGNGASRVFEIALSKTVTLSSLTIRDGSVTANGGGGILNHGTLHMTECTVIACRSTAGGGGVRNEAALDMNRCTVSGNVADASWGGGIDNVFGASLTLTNSTVSGNVAGGNGGGIDNYGASATTQLTACTIADNVAVGQGGGVYADPAAGVVGAYATIFSNGTAGTGPDCSGTISSGGYDLLRSTSGCTVTGGIGNQLNADPALRALQSNGGPTKTHALRIQSPAMDAIPLGNCPAATDQRGQARLQTGKPGADTLACDIGAYEAVHPIPVTTSGDAGTASTCTLRQAVAAANTNAAGSSTCEAGVNGPSMPDRILVPPGTITLTQGELVPSESVMIEGYGADVVSVSGGFTSRVFTMNAGTGANTYVLADLTITKGSKPDGGGIYVYTGSGQDTLVMDRVFYNDNHGDPGPGGSAFRVDHARGVEIARSTFTGGAAAVGLFFLDTSAELVDTTMASMSGSLGIFALQLGDTGDTVVKLVNCTMNGTGTYAIQAQTYSATATARAEYFGTIFAGHSQNFYASSGTLVSLGYNIGSDATGNLTATGDHPSTDPLLGVLAFNGGPTPTVNPKPASPALHAIPINAPATTRDQRGFSRAKALSDIGAVERIVGGDVNGDGSVNVNDVFYLINFLFAGGAVPVGESDVNGDGAIELNDVFYLINRLFAGGAAPI